MSELQSKIIHFCEHGNPSNINCTCLVRRNLSSPLSDHFIM